MKKEKVKKMENKKKNYSGFWRRFIAYFIDMIIIVVFSPVIYFISCLPLMFLNISPTTIIIGISTIFIWLYIAFMESSKYEGTIGKLIVGLQVTTIEGKQLSFVRASLRFLLKSLMGITFIGFIIIPFTTKKQGLHDVLLNTIVTIKSAKIAKISCFVCVILMFIILLLIIGFTTFIFTRNYDSNKPEEIQYLLNKITACPMPEKYTPYKGFKFNFLNSVSYIYINRIYTNTIILYSTPYKDIAENIYEPNTNNYDFVIVNTNIINSFYKYYDYTCMSSNIIKYIAHSKYQKEDRFIIVEYIANNTNNINDFRDFLATIKN